MPKTLDSKMKYIRAYNKQNYKQIVLHLHRSIDKDLIDYLASQPNRAGYLKKLIRSDMDRAD